MFSFTDRLLSQQTKEYSTVCMYKLYKNWSNPELKSRSLNRIIFTPFTCAKACVTFSTAKDCFFQWLSYYQFYICIEIQEYRCVAVYLYLCFEFCIQSAVNAFYCKLYFFYTCVDFLFWSASVVRLLGSGSWILSLLLLAAAATDGLVTRMYCGCSRPETLETQSPVSPS